MVISKETLIMKKIILSFIFLIFFIGCESATEQYFIYDYSIEQRMDCFCSQGGVWVKLFVEADSVASAIRISDNQRLDYGEYKYYKSITELFDLINNTDTTFNYLNYTIDSINNYPSYVYVNPKPIIINDTTIVIISDADVSYTTKNYIKYD